MDTTGGSFALKGSRPKANADIIERVSQNLGGEVTELTRDIVTTSGGNYHREDQSFGRSIHSSIGISISLTQCQEFAWYK